MSTTTKTGKKKLLLEWVSFPAVNREINGHKRPWTGAVMISKKERRAAGRTYGAACRRFGRSTVDSMIGRGRGILRFNAADQNVTAGDGISDGDSDLLCEQVQYIA